MEIQYEPALSRETVRNPGREIQGFAGEQWMIFRAADATDAETIARLHVKSWRQIQRGVLRESYLNDEIEEERLTCWRERFCEADPHRRVILAEDEGRLAGFICTHACADEMWGSLIDNLHVDVPFRRRGLGIDLMRRAAKDLESRHPDTGLFLWVLEGNGPARSFYERLGARVAPHEEQPTPSGDVVACYRYTWPHPRALLESIQRTQKDLRS